MALSISETKLNLSFKTHSVIFFVILSLILGIALPGFAKEYSFSWSPNDGQIDGYNLYYKKGGSAGPPFDGSDATEGESPIMLYDQTTVTSSGLEDNTTYHFALTACSGLDESDYTDVISVYPGDDQQARVQKVLTTIINNYLLLNNG